VRTAHKHAGNDQQTGAHAVGGLISGWSEVNGRKTGIRSEKRQEMSMQNSVMQLPEDALQMAGMTVQLLGSNFVYGPFRFTVCRCVLSTPVLACTTR
jgi:hypothetical protein